MGNRCCIEGGVQKTLEEIGAPDGTTFIIRNLFFNTPARKKFLRSEMSEGSAIHELMTHLALVSSRGGIQSTDRWTDADPDFRKWKPQGCDLSYLWKRCGHASDSGGSAGRPCAY